MKHFLPSSKEDLALSPESVLAAAGNLCYFTEYLRNGRHRLPKSTLETLQNRIDPNFGEREKQTVENLLYIPGCKLVCFCFGFFIN